MRLQVLPLSNRWLIGLIVAATAITGATVLYGFRLGQIGTDDSSQTAEIAPTVRKVVALGQLEPEAEVIQLSAPNPVEASRVAQLSVKQGDRVKRGQVIAILEARNRLQHELKQATEQVSVAQAKLAQVKAGPKSGEIQAQKATINRFQAEQAGELSAQGATIARWQSEVRNARAQYNRFQQLHREGAISTSDLEAKRLALETSQAQLNEAIATRNRTTSSLQAQLSEATATLNQIVEVRPVDVQATQTEVNTAIAAMQRAQADLQQAYIRAPIAGQILKIHTRSGEMIDEEKGIVELGQTNQMVVAAEVYQTDISKVQVGQQAVIASQAFPGELRGTVSQIGLQVNQQKVFSNQPGENLDRRVIEVIVYQILYSNVSEHLTEYATLKAMGYSDRYLLIMLMQEALLLAVLGYLPGFILSLGLYQITYAATLLPIAMKASRAAVVLLLTILMCGASGAIAAQKLRSADPADIF